MAKGRMIVQITVICGCSRPDNLATHYGGGARDSLPGGVLQFLRDMHARGWRELEDDVWLCPACAAEHPRFREKKAATLQPAAV